MNPTPLNPVRSERGVALIMVLLLLAVMSALATGMTVNGHTEITLANNEVYYAGARAAAEAGMNRAAELIENDSTTANLLTGAAGRFVAVWGAGPYTLGQYTYTAGVFDDDDDSLYDTPLDPTQDAAMNENGNPALDQNGRLVLRIVGFGPSGTTVRLGRIIQVDVENNPAVWGAPVVINPAILVDGSLTVSGNIDVMGSQGSIHANGNLALNGNTMFISENATASGGFSANANWTSGSCPSDCGTMGGGFATINVPEVNAADHLGYATHILRSDGTILRVSTNTVVTVSGWSFSGGNWSLTGNDEPTGTFYAQTSVTVSGNRGSSGSPLALSIISEGSITVTGNSTLRPENAAALQFVANGDLILGGNLDADQSTVEGRSLVREQLSIAGNPDLRGQIIVKNRTSVFNEATTNTISGNPDITYNGSFANLITPGLLITPATQTFNNNVRGWIEG
jgi:hypothetical protein